TGPPNFSITISAGVFVMGTHLALSAIKMQQKICEITHRMGQRRLHNVRMDYRRWLQGEFQRTGKPKAGLARVWGRSEGAVSRALSGKRQLKADEYEKARAYFTTPVDESITVGTQTRPQEEEKEANVQDVIEHIHVMIDEYGV